MTSTNAVYSPTSQLSMVYPAFNPRSGFDVSTPSDYKLVPDSVFVTGLKPEVTAQELYTYFKQFGNAIEAKVIMDSANKSKGYGFIKYNSPEEANAILSFNNLKMRGRPLKIGPARRRLSSMVVNAFTADNHMPTAYPNPYMYFAAPQYMMLPPSSPFAVSAPPFAFPQQIQQLTDPTS
ncbi:RNA recognition motif domain-containing protein [Ditylenchus destructor]|nr:RNA recognition motif domain-containing protein [Ditylenchus destructor]